MSDPSEDPLKYEQPRRCFKLEGKICPDIRVDGESRQFCFK